MKKLILATAIMALTSIVNAEYFMKIPLEKSQGGSLPDGSVSITSDWQSSQTVYGEWIYQGHPYECSNWSPSPSTITIGQSFTQTATDCNQEQTRTAQDTEIESISGIVQNSGEPYTESRTITVSSTRDSVGTMETWVAATPTYTSWSNTNALYGCTNWSPAGSTITSNSTFTQTATNCSTDQSRTRQAREQESTTLVYRNIGTAVTENRTLTGQSATRSYTVTLGSWTNSGGKYGCSNWSPATSTVTSGKSFTQTATDCEQNQTRSRVEKYVDHKSGATVQVSSTSETKTITGQTSTRTAIGAKVDKVCIYNNVWNGSYWSTGIINVVYWQGTQIGSTKSVSSVSYGGYLYTPGAYQGSGISNSSNYQVCRQPL